jgi:hypothetical protein
VSLGIKWLLAYGDSKVVVDGEYVYPIPFGLARGQVLHCSQGTLLP